MATNDAIVLKANLEEWKRRTDRLVFPALALAGNRAEWYSSRLQGRSNEHSGGWLCLPENAAQIEKGLGNGDLLHR
jgi:hypothetical protein